MAMTTIRVEAEVRDRLAARATTHGRSLGAELQAMLDEMMWQGIEAGDRRLATHWEEVGAYQGGGGEWRGGGGAGPQGRAPQGGEGAPYRAEAVKVTPPARVNLPATAADEYPEYNS